jgi:signal transduction histidine kinase
MIGSLQARLLIAIGALGVLALLAVALAARQGTRQGFSRLQELERSVDGPAPAADTDVATRLERRCCERHDLAAAAEGLGEDVVVLVTDPASGALIGAAGRRADSAERLDTRRTGEVLGVELTTSAGGARELVSLRFRQAGVPITLPDGREAVVHVVHFPNPARARLVRDLLVGVDRRLLLATALVGLLALASTWAIVRGSVGPLDDLRRAAGALARGELTARVVPRGSREVVDLGRDFNAMAEAIERQQALRRQLLHDVAHELRTPLTALRCRLETVIDGMARDPARAVHDLHDEVRHLTRLVDDLQDVALAEARELALDMREVRVEEIIGSALAAAGLEADARVKVESGHALTVPADPVRLRQVLLNLLTNASRHTPEGGTIGLAASRGDGGVVITVRNTGSQLTDDEAARVFDRFYRTDPSRQRTTGGSGLGLAIVKHLVEAHGGRVWASADTEGVTFGVALPDRAIRPQPAAS